MAKNLTGNKRIIYDSCVDIYNAVQKWRSLLLESHLIILKIWKEKENNNNNSDMETEEHLIAEYSPEVFANLESLVSELHRKMENMESIVQKVIKTTLKISAISELSDLQQSNSISFTDQIPFKAWPFSKFSTVAEEIASMFKEELSVKSSISREICTISEKSVFLFFESCWKYEPAIDNVRLNMLLDGILCELELFSEIK